MLTAIVAVACGVAGYLVGRARPRGWDTLGGWLLSWAEDQTTVRQLMWRRWYDPRLWAALSILAVALAWMWTVHPRRSAANRRAWREEHHEPAPVMDPDWAAKRSSEGAS